MRKIVAHYDPATGQILHVSVTAHPESSCHPFVEVERADPTLCLTHKVVAGALVARGADDPPWAGRLAPPEPAYRIARRAAYPSIADQLDAIWKGGEAADAMRAAVMAVKAALPKDSH